MLENHDPAGAVVGSPKVTSGQPIPDVHGNQLWIGIAGLCGLFAVGLGAFGSHGLRSVVTPEMLAAWRTGVEYQLFHTLAILAVGLAPGHLGSALWRWPLRLWATGICLFSGSLYAMVLTGARIMGAITPIGGVCFMAGWLLLFWAAWTRHRASARD